MTKQLHSTRFFPPSSRFNAWHKRKKPIRLPWPFPPSARKKPQNTPTLQKREGFTPSSRSRDSHTTFFTRFHSLFTAEDINPFWLIYSPTIVQSFTSLGSQCILEASDIRLENPSKRRGNICYVEGTNAILGTDRFILRGQRDFKDTSHANEFVALRLKIVQTMSYLAIWLSRCLLIKHTIRYVYEIFNE